MHLFYIITESAAFFKCFSQKITEIYFRGQASRHCSSPEGRRLYEGDCIPSTCQRASPFKPFSLNFCKMDFRDKKFRLRQISPCNFNLAML